MGRAPAPEAEPPLPARRRAVFFDVENSSRAEHIAQMFDQLALDRGARRTEILAVGNWRVIGHDTARFLARHGAQLVHTAPATGVRDWSDLRIAIACGVWLAGARPGDLLEIVSDDRAFDAVGDVATSLGVEFRRASYRGLAASPSREAPTLSPAPPDGRAPAAPPRRRRRRRRRTSGPGRPPAAGATTTARPPGAGPPEARPHTAPHDEVLHVVQDLIAAASGEGVTIDAVANTLKARGFSRPTGSPRLITRLRRFKAISVNRTGLITLSPDGGEGGARGAGESSPRAAGAPPLPPARTASVPGPV